MDNLTHALSGVILSRAGLNRLAPQAGWLLVMAANAPDAEVISGLWDSTVYLDLHRGPTHALAFAPLVALAPLPVWRWLARKAHPGRREWAGAYACSLLGVLSHILFDWTNAYGVRLALPFSERWFRLDWLFVADLWVWAILGAGVAAAALARLVYGEIGAKPGSGRAGALAVLALLGLYLGVRAEAHARAVAVLESRIYQGQAPKRAYAIPGPVNLLRWRGLVETAGAWRSVEVDLLREFDPGAGRVYYAPEPSAALEAARATPVMRAFQRFAQAPVWQVSPAPQPEGAWVVTAADLRFGELSEGRFMGRVVVDARGRVLEQNFQF
jgi:inner membrane protein